ncbi:MAG TPA: hypothetical protein VKR29_07205 [Candidatus Binataceae bacterium]|nr:hypothetical protein [Candidatus Binataceae bacterium]
MIDTNAIAASANADGEFKLAARLWNANVRFDIGADIYLMRMREGRISDFSKTPATQYDVKISAPEEDWRELLKPVPRPFYQDLMAAMTRHNFRVEGDLLGFNPYYRAVCRLFELMRTIR